MEIDEEDSRDFFQSVFNNVVNDLGSINIYLKCPFSELYVIVLPVTSPHTLKQRRWRRNRKEKPYSSHLPLSLQTVEQTVNNLVYIR
jgi:hypothetical protein